MINLIGGEIYRLLHKKSMYIYFASLAAAYILLAFIRSGGFRPESVLTDAVSAFGLLPAIAGGFLFSAIYTDDLNSKNLISLVGFGISKVKIVVAKFALMALFGTVIFGIAPLFHCAAYALFGQIATMDAVMTISAISLKYLLVTVAFSALAGIVVYGFQRTTFAIVMYLLLAFNIISSLLTIGLNMIDPMLRNHLISGITDRIMTGIMSGSSSALSIMEYIIYVLIAATLTAAVFYKKEMEF